MKYFAPSIALVLIASSCGVEVLTTTAIQGELQAQQLKAMDRQLGAAGDTTARVRLKKAIDTYAAEKGEYPPSLQVLAPDYLPSIPRQSNGQPFGYDPVRGIVLDGPVATGPSQADNQKLERIRGAVDLYGRSTGYYPASLEVLVPNYLSAIPLTEEGLSFQYNPQTGAVYHPGAFSNGAAMTPQQHRAGPGGAGPMGEAMTGIQMQNQLNSMSSGGTNRAGGQARNGVRGITQGYNERQMRAVEEYQ